MFFTCVCLPHRNSVWVWGPVPPASGAGASPVEPVPRVSGEGTGWAETPPHGGPRGGEPGGRNEKSRLCLSVLAWGFRLTDTVLFLYCSRRVVRHEERFLICQHSTWDKTYMNNYDQDTAFVLVCFISLFKDVRCQNVVCAFLMRECQTFKRPRRMQRSCVRWWCPWSRRSQPWKPSWLQLRTEWRNWRPRRSVNTKSVVQLGKWGAGRDINQAGKLLLFCKLNVTKFNDDDKNVI